MYQIPMDDPCVLWIFYGEVVKSGEEAMYHKLINISSWSVHIEQESLITAADKSG